MKTPEGRVYGSIGRSELDDRVSEGRVLADCQILQAGGDQWRWASEVYTGLDTAPASSQPVSVNTQSATPNSLSSAVLPGNLSEPFRQPHRGGLILMLALLGWAICFPFSIFAWTMGSSDLRAMGTGRMDSGGRGLTQVGMILGMIQCILVMAGIGLAAVALMFGVLAGAVGG